MPTHRTPKGYLGLDHEILTAALNTVGCPVIVGQSARVREGAEACRFVVSSPATDSRWDGRRH